ncbi:olfactory receptor 6B2-like protein [Cricetulus griseus]|nr:olfactory receptor 6B2-like protein [Cricetulus griseus]
MQTRGCSSGFTISVIKVYFISSATFCGSNVLNHFFCDISPILKLACTDFSTAELVDFILAFLILVFPLLATILSYGHITLAVLRIPSATGRWRAFSTCASHLTVVTIFYTALLFIRQQALLGQDELVDFILAFIILVFPLLATILSYGYITLAVLRIPSATGRWRAFSTCASHLTVVTFFYVAMLFIYVRPQAIDTRSSNKLISAVYTVLTPILNPLIYCLRNKEFKDAMRRTLGLGTTLK